ncbi:tRNA sulfurtransferase [Serratia symbiotica]|nr:tRNA sulfurtransferase [Serratia symbiotica]
MKLIIKLFPEITIKSRSVRLHFIKILSSNIRNILKQYDASLVVVRHWDYIEVRAKDGEKKSVITDALTRIPGIHHILEAEDHTYTNVHHIFEKTLDAYGKQLVGKTFCVRVKRRGAQDFNSQDLERYVGGGLNQHIESARVNLSSPQVMVNLEIKDNKLIFLKSRTEGIGGYPIGTQEDVLSLISGGFDSAVSSYMLMRRGCRVHFCFFNLGGAGHEVGVKQLAYYLWTRFATSHKVRFISIDFRPVMHDILEKVNGSDMGVVLKRMMVRAASQVAKRYRVQALVTGEVLGQVSSQTLTNLRLIDNASDMLILRPLISYDKEHIIKLAREIGTEDFQKTIPEYCAVISNRPTVKAIKAKIDEEESQLDFSILERVLIEARNIDIRNIDQQVQEQVDQVETVLDFSTDEVILDIRSDDEQKKKPLQLEQVKVKSFPFYRLGSQFSSLDQRKTYLLYCERGLMSRLQALYLVEKGYSNVKVYRPYSS